MCGKIEDKENVNQIIMWGCFLGCVGEGGEGGGEGYHPQIVPNSITLFIQYALHKVFLFSST